MSTFREQRRRDEKEGEERRRRKGGSNVRAHLIEKSIFYVTISFKSFTYTLSAPYNTQEFAKCMFDAKYSISYLQFVRVSYEEAGKTISYFTHVDAHFTSRFFHQFFRAKKKKKSIDCISFFFRIAHVYIKKENKKNRTEISTPSSRYLLQKQVTKLRHLFNRNIPFFENEHYRNEDTRNAFCKILILENFILFKLSNKIQRRREKEKIFQQTIGINIYIIHRTFHTFSHESIIKF